jgi:hypothetical protein
VDFFSAGEVDSLGEGSITSAHTIRNNFNWSTRK